jgi:hypothetical protein
MSYLLHGSCLLLWRGGPAGGGRGRRARGGRAGGPGPVFQSFKVGFCAKIGIHLSIGIGTFSSNDK